MSEELIEGELTNQIIGAAIEVHRCLGPGLLENIYETCLAHELALRGLAFARQHTYMRLTGTRVGLLLNFNAPTIRAGLVRRVS